MSSDAMSTDVLDKLTTVDNDDDLSLGAEGSKSHCHFVSFTLSHSLSLAKH